MENKKSMMVIDCLVGLIAFIIVIVCCFFRTCALDIAFFIVAAVIIAAGTAFLMVQNKRKN